MPCYSIAETRVGSSYSTMVRQGIASVLCAALGAVAHGDMIVVDGDRHENVYIRSSETMYYVLDPSDGSIFNVRKSSVAGGAIEFTADRKERARLLEDWERARDARRLAESGSKPDPGLDARLKARRDSRKSEQKSVQFTNIARKLEKRRKKQHFFVNSEGVTVLTNTPGRFRNDREYIEIKIPYDPVFVPEQFRNRPSRAQFVSSNLHELVTYYANHYQLAPELVYAVIRVESNFNPTAVSTAGARGLMQLMPATASDMRVTNVFDPAQNIAGGTQYLSKLLDHFDGDLTLALAGYNAGPGNVKKYGGIPPFKETQDYIHKVRRFHNQYKSYGAPRFAARRAGELDLSYLPPGSAKYYRLTLDNGLVVSAETVVEEDGDYVCIFEHKAPQRYPKERVVAFREPSAVSTTD